MAGFLKFHCICPPSLSKLFVRKYIIVQVLALTKKVGFIFIADWLASWTKEKQETEKGEKREETETRFGREKVKRFEKEAIEVNNIITTGVKPVSREKKNAHFVFMIRELS